MDDIVPCKTLPGFLGFYGKFLVCLLFQVLFWSQTWYVSPSMEMVPPVPGEKEAQIFAMGDKQLYFRWHAFNIQNAGWTYGRDTPLRELDYNKIYYWFKLLDVMDDESNFVPALASYYYSRTEKVSDIRYLVAYLHEYAGHRLVEKWWWQAEAVHLADHKLNDRDLALEMALPLQNIHGIPIIIRELPAFIYERRGEMKEARRVMEEIMANTKLSQGELNFITYFITQRLNRRDPETLYFDQRKRVD